MSGVARCIAAVCASVHIIQIISGWLLHNRYVTIKHKLLQIHLTVVGPVDQSE